MENIDVILRPKTLSQLYASEAEKVVLDKASYKHLGHSFLIVGQTGTGKTTTGRAIATYLFTGQTSVEYDLFNTQCYKEVNASDYTGVDDMRALLRAIEPQPLMDDKTVVIFDEAHNLSKQAQSALLKCLEEPPEHLYLLICTDQPQKLLPTVRNRCELINLIRPSEQTLITYAREFVIPRLVQMLEQDESNPQWRQHLESLNDSMLHNIVVATDYSYRSMIKLVHSYILTGKIQALAPVHEPVLNSLMKLVINPQPGWREPIIQTIKSTNNFEDLRIALCNYVGVCYINNMNRIQFEPGPTGTDQKYINVIKSLKEPLSLTCQKADFISRMSTIILQNAGKLQ